MKINLATEKGREKLAQALAEAQKHCRTRTVTAEQIVQAAIHIVAYIGIPRTHMAGCRFVLDLNAQNFPNAYKGRPESTLVTLEFTGGHFSVTDIRRGDTMRAGHEITTLTLTDEAKEAIIHRYDFFN